MWQHDLARTDTLKIVLFCIYQQKLFAVESLPTSSQSRQVTAEEEEVFSDSFFTDDDHNDTDFEPSKQETPDPSSEELPSSCEQTDLDPIKSCKLLVFWCMLLPLFTICRNHGCGAHVDSNNISLQLKGACAIVTSTCNNNHTTKV